MRTARRICRRGPTSRRDLGVETAGSSAEDGGAKSQGSHASGEPAERQEPFEAPVIRHHTTDRPGPAFRQADARPRMDQGPLTHTCTALIRLPREDPLGGRTKIGMTAALVVELDLTVFTSTASAGGPALPASRACSCLAPPRSLARHAESSLAPARRSRDLRPLSQSDAPSIESNT